MMIDGTTGNVEAASHKIPVPLNNTIISFPKSICLTLGARVVPIITPKEIAPR